jgi:hypothetical protein
MYSSTACIVGLKNYTKNIETRSSGGTRGQGGKNPGAARVQPCVPELIWVRTKSTFTSRPAKCCVRDRGRGTAWSGLSHTSWGRERWSVWSNGGMISRGRLKNSKKTRFRCHFVHHGSNYVGVNTGACRWNTYVYEIQGIFKKATRVGKLTVRKDLLHFISVWKQIHAASLHCHQGQCILPRLLNSETHNTRTVVFAV